jgi:nucleotidyltransferase substrate binding protein (TIGR01987 family)
MLIAPDDTPAATAGWIGPGGRNTIGAGSGRLRYDHPSCDSRFIMAYPISLGQAAKSDSACTAMTPAPIDLTPLQRALDALAGALAYWQAEPGDSGRKPHLRAGVIQSFEFSYELAVRLLRRVLMERALAAQSVADLSFNDLLRAGADAGLLPDPLSWRRWRDWRNRTSHGYNETEAQAIAEAAQVFLVDAQALLKHLKRAVNDDT